MDSILLSLVLPHLKPSTTSQFYSNWSGALTTSPHTRKSTHFCTKALKNCRSFLNPNLSIQCLGIFHDIYLFYKVKVQSPYFAKFDHSGMKKFHSNIAWLAPNLFHSALSDATLSTCLSMFMYCSSSTVA